MKKIISYTSVCVLIVAFLTTGAYSGSVQYVSAGSDPLEGASADPAPEVAVDVTKSVDEPIVPPKVDVAGSVEVIPAPSDDVPTPPTVDATDAADEADVVPEPNKPTPKSGIDTGNTQTCSIPNSLRDSGKRTIEPNDETSLQTMLNDAGFNINAVTDQQSYQTWGSLKPTSAVEFELIGKISSLNNVFGYYVNNDINTFQPIFKSGNHSGYPATPAFINGQKVTVNIPTAKNIAFATDVEFPSDTDRHYKVATESQLNDGGFDQVLAYNASGKDNYILAFEDVEIPHSDTDYNDMVVRVKFQGCGISDQVNTAPVLTLLGNSPMTINVGTTFTDPGATAFDTEEGNITSRIVATGTVDTNTVGTYSRIYRVTDSHGLTDSETRTVNVITSPAGGNGGGNNGGNGGNGGGRRGRNNSNNNNQNNNQNGQVLGAAIGPNNCMYLNSYLHRDWNNDSTDVFKLQAFLKSQSGFNGLNMNGKFDDETFDAVSKFQSQYLTDVLSPWGYLRPTGFVYITTMKKINEIYCQKEFPLTNSQKQEITEERVSNASLALR